MPTSKRLRRHLNALKEHLRNEHPGLVPLLPHFRELDRVLRRLGLMSSDESVAGRISWWPVITTVGMFSSGKSTFINETLGVELQRTGNQAVDDKFTVICYGQDNGGLPLPGMALDSDARFPFYNMGQEVERVAPGEGKMVDAFLQLKTCPSEHLRGKILVDSPGFDSDDQRRATLRLTSHIIDLSDLVLVFFDARRPEPGAMQDTLDHLVTNAVKRSDSTKFLYILNQIDTAADEDNVDDIMGAWQRAVAQAGLVSGRFYTVFSRHAGEAIADPEKRRRYEAKRDADLDEIERRIAGVEMDRGYRIAGMAERLSRELETEVIPALQHALGRWRRRMRITHLSVVVLVLAAVLGVVAGIGTWPFAAAWNAIPAAPVPLGLLAVGVLLLLGGYLTVATELTRRGVARGLTTAMGPMELNLRAAFHKSATPWRAVIGGIAGWRESVRRRLARLREHIAEHIQQLNDTYTDPGAKRVEPGVRERPAGGQEMDAATVAAATTGPRAESAPEPRAAPAAGSDADEAAAPGGDAAKAGEAGAEAEETPAEEAAPEAPARPSSLASGG